MRLYLFWPIIIILALNGCADKYEHDPNLAARTAEFAILAFVKQDYDGAYALLADGIRRHVSPDQFKQTLTKNQSGSGAPTKVTAREYEPMSGEKAIYVYLTGDSGGEPSGYRITLEGTAAAGYKVLRFDRGGGLNLPGSDRKPLKE